MNIKKFHDIGNLLNFQNILKIPCYFQDTGVRKTMFNGGKCQLLQFFIILKTSRIGGSL